MRKQKKDAEEKRRPKIRIKLKAYDYKIVDNSAKQIIELAARYGVGWVGPVPLPTEIHKYTVNRSTFVHKDAREQYEIRIHKRIIDILNPNARIIEALKNQSLPSGVNVEIKMLM